MGVFLTLEAFMEDSLVAEMVGMLVDLVLGWACLVGRVVTLLLLLSDIFVPLLACRADFLLAKVEGLTVAF